MNRQHNQRMRWGYVAVMLFALLVLPGGVAWAQPIVPCNPQATTDPGGDPIISGNCSLTDLLALPVNIFNFLLGFAAVVFFGIIIFSGVRMIMFQFSDLPEAELTAAKNTLRNGIMGFVIVVAAILIINLVLGVLGIYQNSTIYQLLSNFDLVS